MEQQNFDNMIKVLSYFAEQCELFKPMLDGVTTLKSENDYLNAKLKYTTTINNRLQLGSTFSADYANFGITTVKTTGGDTESEKDPKISHTNDLYNLIKAVIKVGKDNYVRTDMEYKLDFYNMLERISLEQYMELLSIIKEQHSVITPEPIKPIDPPPEDTPPNPEENENTQPEQPKEEYVVAPQK